LLGAGPVGLVTGVCYVQRGNFVSIYEKDLDKRKALASGTVPFYEPNLDRFLKDALETGRLDFVSEPTPAIAASEISFVAVGTPG